MTGDTFIVLTTDTVITYLFVVIAYLVGYLLGGYHMRLKMARFREDDEQ